MGLATWANTHSYTPTPRPPQSELPAQRSLQTGHERSQHTSPPPQTQLATGDVEAGAELGEGRGREILGENVGELGGGRDVKDPNIADGNPISDEV